YLEFETEEQKVKSMKEMNGMDVLGKNIKILSFTTKDDIIKLNNYINSKIEEGEILDEGSYKKSNKDLKSLKKGFTDIHKTDKKNIYDSIFNNKNNKDGIEGDVKSEIYVRNLNINTTNV